MLQKCKHCGTAFKYKRVQKAFWSGQKVFVCENCGSKHKLTNYGILPFIFILPMFFMGIPRLTNPIIDFSLVIFYLCGCVLILPYILKLKIS